MPSPKEKLLAAIREFDGAVKGDRRYSRICDRLYELSDELDRMPEPKDEGETPGQRSAREASGKNFPPERADGQRQGAPSFMRRRGSTAREGTR